jgi:hypothetical protein
MLTRSLTAKLCSVAVMVIFSGSWHLRKVRDSGFLFDRTWGFTLLYGTLPTLVVIEVGNQGRRGQFARVR